MPRRVKDEEKTEMIIRGLLKQEDNRRCINCNTLGPQYVCTTFWTFVCTNCSGVHREFNHRVKSVSMAKFKEEEIMALQAGGNERAKEIYFKTWDSQRNTYPESSNLQRLREFVNHVYVDRRYSGDKNANKLSMVKLDSKSNSCDWPFDRPGLGRRDDLRQRFSFDRTGRRGRDDSSLSDNNKVLNLKDFLEERSPRLSQEKPRGRSTRFEIVDDRYREDGTVKTYERHVTRESRSASNSPGSQSGRTMSLPAIRPLKSIVGDKVPALRIEGPHGASGGKDGEGSAGVQTSLQKAATIPGPSGGIEKQNNAASSSSLIDFFDAESEPSSTPAQPQPHSTPSNANNESSSSSNQTAANIQNLLLDWSSPVASPSSGTKAPETSNSFGALANDQPYHSEPKNPIVQDIQMHQLPTSPTPVESSSSPYWNKSPLSNDLRRVQSVPLEKPSHTINPEGSSPSARKEIPQDLFASPFNPTVGGWPMHQPQGAAYGMQFHHPMMSAAAFPNSPKPRNPFDIGDDRFQVQAATFPSMSSMQGALPNMPASTALESQTLPYATAPPSQSHMSPYGMNIPLVPGAYMGQLPNNMLLTRPEGNANVGRTEDAFASLNPIQQTSGIHSSPAVPTSPLPRGGNPFG